jgi:hypothetical protein
MHHSLGSDVTHSTAALSIENQAEWAPTVPL